MPKSKSKKASSKISTSKSTGPGRGHFKATPLTFTGTDGVSYTYMGRGRYSVPLALVIVSKNQLPVRGEDGAWSWRDATAEELAGATAMVEKVKTRIMEKAALKTAREEKRAAAKAAKAAAKEAKAAKAAAKAPKAPKASKPRKVKETVEEAVEVPATAPAAVTEEVAAPVAE